MQYHLVPKYLYHSQRKPPCPLPCACLMLSFWQYQFARYLYRLTYFKHFFITCYYDQIPDKQFKEGRGFLWHTFPSWQRRPGSRSPGRAEHMTPSQKKTVNRKWGCCAIKPSSPSSGIWVLHLLKVLKPPKQHCQVSTTCSHTWAYGGISHLNHKIESSNI